MQINRAHLFIAGIKWKVMDVIEFKHTIRIPFCPPLPNDLLKTKKCEISLEYFYFEIAIDGKVEAGTITNRRYNLVDVK